MDEITVIDVPPQKVIGMHKRGKYEIIAQMMPQMFQFAVSKGIQIRGPPVFVCHETTPEAAMKADAEGTADVELAIPIEGNIEETEEIKSYELPGGKMAKIVHKGAYKDAGLTYEKLFAWLGQNNKKITGPTREVYLNDPREVPETELLTEIYAPIK